MRVSYFSAAILSRLGLDVTTIAGVHMGLSRYNRTVVDGAWRRRFAPPMSRLAASPR